MRTRRGVSAIIAVTAVAACTTAPDEQVAPPPPGAAASVEAVAERLSDLTDEYRHFPYAVATCGQTNDLAGWQSI